MSLLIIVLLAVLGVEIAYDGWSTQALVKKGYTELDPLAKWFVSHGPWGQTLGCVLGFLAAAIAILIPQHFGFQNVAAVVAGIIAFLEGAKCVRQYEIIKAAK